MAKQTQHNSNGLPEGWEWKPINQIAKIKGGKRLPKGSSFAFNKTKFPYIRVTDFIDSGTIDISSLRYIDEVTQAQIKNYTITSDDLYISIAGTIGKTGIIPKELNGANLTENAVKLEYIDKRKIENKYVYLFTQSRNFLEQAGLATKAVAMPKLAITRLAQIQIPLPPLTEQRRIVARLDALFEKIDKAIALTTENIENTRHLLPAALNELFGEAEKSKVKSEKLKIITTKIGSGSTPSGGQRAYKTSGISLIRSMNVYDEGFEMDGLAYIDDDQAHKLSNVVVEKDDVLLNITGASVARCCIAPEHVLPARVNQHVSILRFRKNLILPEFAHYFFISPDTKFKLLKDSGGGATREAITKAMLEDFEIRFPDIKQQQHIVTYLNQLSQRQQQLLLHYEKQLQQLQQLKASILDTAFRGSL